MHVHAHLPLEELQHLARAIVEKRIWVRYQAIILASQGRSAAAVASALGCEEDTVAAIRSATVHVLDGWVDVKLSTMTSRPVSLISGRWLTELMVTFCTALVEILSRLTLKMAFV